MTRSPILIGFYTMVRKDFRRIVRIWSQTLLPPAITMALYFAIFGTFIGSQVDAIHGFPYIQFIVPGLIMMSVITSSYMNTVSTFYFAKWIRTIDEILVSPMPSWVVIAGFVSGGLIRAFLVGLIVIGVSLFFTHLTLFSVGVIFAAAFLTALLFSLLGLINAIFAKSFDAINIVPTFVLTPLTYLGGVFYSIDQLPPLFQTVSLFNPILYMVNAFRYGFLGISDVPLSLAFEVMGGLTLLAFIVTIILFKRGAGLKQ
ncbi:MAG: ABC-2 type transport system permease protein [Parcubacteria bacterium C7867-004]|nr:MAG: ABC-2 type transport system permease protein [Parcubacteria bacterium C7867-004]